MTNEIMTIDQVKEVAKISYLSRMFQMPNIESMQTLMLLCQSEGIHPLQALKRYHIIKGRPSMRADAMQAEFQRSGGKVEWTKRTEKECSAIFSHEKLGSVSITWTIEMARTAGLMKYRTDKNGDPTMWYKYPRQMLTARVISEGIRTINPAIVAGIYTPEEVSDFDTKSGKPEQFKSDDISDTEPINTDYQEHTGNDSITASDNCKELDKAQEIAEKARLKDIKKIFTLAKKTGLKTDQDIKTSIESIIDKKIGSSSELNLKQIETIIDSYNKCIENSKKANVVPPKEKTSNVDDKPNTLTSLDKLKNILANKSLKAASLEVCKSMSISLSELMTAPDAIVTAFVNKILNNEQHSNPTTQGEKIAANIKLARGMLVKLGCKTIEDCQTLAGSLIDRELKIDGDLHELSAAEMDTLIDKLDIQLSGL